MPAPSPKRPSNVVALPRAPRTNVRPRLGPFIGRERVLERIQRTLDDGARLVTLLGPPGIGKTRTAEKVLELSRDPYVAHGGAWFCDLREVKDAPGLAHAVASLWPLLEAAHLADEDVGTLVAEHLAEAGPMLLALDNFEQLASGDAPDAVRRWCQVAPELVILVTSRARLGVEGEVVIDLAPLGCPGENDSPAQVLASEAVRLLAARAEAVGGEVGSDPAVLGALVRQLDGIPLAIELAAARTRLLRPSDLVTRLQQRFDVGGEATLASAIAWSWNLLSPGEQRALAECSVFAGGFTVDAAEHVLSNAPVVERVAALRDKSLLHVSGDGGRLALYVSIREYAGDRLDAYGVAFAGAAHARHARHYAARAREFNRARTFQGAAPDADLRAELSHDRENLLAALAWIRGTRGEGPEDAVEVLAELAMALTLLQAAPADLCLDALGAALETSGAPKLHVRLLLARHYLLNAVGRFDESRADMQALLGIGALSPGLRAYALVMQGIQLRYQSSPRPGWESHVAAAKELEALDLPRMRAMNLACMGRLQCDFGDETKGREYNERARALCVEIGDRWLEALPLANVAQLEQEKGNFAAALELLEQALARFRSTNEPQYEALYSATLGDLYFEWGQPDRARQSYATAAPFLSAWVAHRGTAILYASWGALEAGHGDRTLAQAHIDRARRSVRRADSAVVRLIVDLGEASLRLRAARDASDVARIAREADVFRTRLVDEREHIASSIDVRFAVRMFERARDRGARPSVAPLPSSLRVGKNGAWFEIEGTPSPPARVDLLRRGSLRRILLALARRHRTSPDGALDQDTLLASGWPGERLLTEAAGTRLRVAVATLRRLGLRDVLLTRDDGYLLDSAVKVDLEGDL